MILLKDAGESFYLIVSFHHCMNPDGRKVKLKIKLFIDKWCQKLYKDYA